MQNQFRWNHSLTMLWRLTRPGENSTDLGGRWTGTVLAGSHLQTMPKCLTWSLCSLNFSLHVYKKNRFLSNPHSPKTFSFLKIAQEPPQEKVRKAESSLSEMLISLQSQLWDFGDVFSPAFWVSLQNYRVTLWPQAILKYISIQATSLGVCSV